MLDTNPLGEQVTRKQSDTPEGTSKLLTKSKISIFNFGSAGSHLPLLSTKGATIMMDKNDGATHFDGTFWAYKGKHWLQEVFYAPKRLVIFLKKNKIPDSATLKFF